MNTFTMVPALIGFVSTVAILYAIRLIILSRSVINISGAILLITMSCALIGYLFQLVISDLTPVLFWQKIQVLGINFMYPAWLIFILLLTGNRRFICWRLLVLLFVVSLFPNLVLNAPTIRHWFVITKGLVEIGPFNVLNQDLGWVVWFSTSIATIQGIVGSVILFNQRKKLRSSYKPHFYLLLLLPLVPFIAIWVEISGSNPIAPLSIFNLSLIPVCGIITYVIYILRIGEEHIRLKENVVDSMHSAVLILDSMDRIQYVNSAAGKLFELPIESTKNKPLANILPTLSEYLTKTSSQNDGMELITIKDFVFDIKVNTTEDWRGEPVTKMIVLTNITEIDQLETTIIDRNREITHKNTLLSGLAEVNLYFQSTNKLEDMFGVLDNVLSNIGLSFFISTFEPVSNDLVVNYLTSDDSAVKRIEGLLGSKVTGYHIPEKLFPQVYDFMNGSIAEQSYSSTMLLSDENLHPVVRESIRLLGIDLNLPIFMLQLKAATKPIGFLGVWGTLLEDKDFPTLRIFANQMALAIERHQLYQNEINHSKELARSNKLITALVNVATLMGSSGEYTESLRTLGQELEELQLHCILGILDEKAETIVFKYSSFTPGVLELITKLTKINFTGYELHKKYWPGTTVMSEGVPVWYGDTLGIFQKMFPQIPDLVFSKIMKKMGITDGQNLCILPLILKGKVAGILPVWGEGITEKDTTALTVFAYQVGEILARMKDYENEQNRANRLARSNAILIALSRVASRLETNSDLNEIYKTLGAELKSVNIECMVGTLDEKKENLTIEYLSISPVIFDYARSNNIKWPGQIRVPRSLWPTDTAIKNKEPYWDANPVASVSKMFPFVPKKIMAHSFRAMGMPEDFRICYLPIIVNDNVIGIMSVWGPDLQEEDIRA